jgi:hypothetical protein
LLGADACLVLAGSYTLLIIFGAGNREYPYCQYQKSFCTQFVHEVDFFEPENTRSSN